MFRKKRTTINGVELPEDFQVSSVINNIAISNDGRYAAVTRGGDLVIADVPKNGRIEMDGTTINYQKGTGSGKMNIQGSSIRMSSISSGSVVVSGGSTTISVNGGSNLEYEIDQGYGGISRLSLNEQANDINLGLSEDGKVYVKGLTSKEPEYASGRLNVNGLNGTLLLPKSIHDLEQDLRTMSGDIDGDVAHQGRIKTLSGDISIKLLAPLIVEVSTLSGEIDVRGMIRDGRNIYRPSTGDVLGTLQLETLSGDIDLRYKIS